MATTEEKTELVETLKGPRYYRIHISGYGGEAAYMSISKEAHDFWKHILDDHGDNDLVTYMVADDPEEYNFENIDSVPPEADFLMDEDFKRPWYESHTEYEHQWGPEFGSAYMDIDEVDSPEYNANVINEVMSREGVEDMCNRIGDETDWEVELYDSTECYAGEDVEYVAQMYSSEKGSFFDGIIETVGAFDPKKLVFRLSEYDNGEQSITAVEYDGVDVDNQGGDTNGKGYYASVWKN
jgi:hypothetical protein